MKKLCLLAGVVLSIAGCASSDTAGNPSNKERVADSYAPTGTFIPRKKSERGAVNTTEVDKQMLQNEQMTGNGTNNGIGR